MDETWRFFALGVVGSLALEAANVISFYEAGRPLPARYKRWGFWVPRIALAIVGGILAASINQLPKNLWALYVGAGAQAIIAKYGHRPPWTQDPS